MTDDSVVQRVVRGETSRRSSSREKGAVCFEFERGGSRRRVRIARDIEPHYSDAIQVSEPDARDYSDKLPEHPIPSSGELGEDCGRLIPAIGCDHCWTTKEVGRTCRSPDCPRCWQSWAFHRGIDMAAKLHDLAKKVNYQTFKHHLTVSPRDSTRFNSKDPFNQGIEAIKPLLEKVNVSTGYLIYHPWRIEKEHRGDVLGHESGSGDKGWKDILHLVESEGQTWEEVEDEYLIYSPHFHVLCLSNTVEKSTTSDIENETGVVIHRIEQKRKDGGVKSIANLEELCKSAAYSLSHTSIAPESERQTHRAGVRAFGQVANHSVDDKAPSRQEVKEAMRKVAPKVLGVEFPEPECHETVTGHSHGDESDGAGANYLKATKHLSGGGTGNGSAISDSYGPVNDDTSSWDATAGSVPSGLDVVSDGQGEPCTGKMVPIWALEPKLGDLEEINRVEEQFGRERVHELRRALEEWHELGEPTPNTEALPPNE